MDPRLPGEAWAGWRAAGNAGEKGMKPATAEAMTRRGPKSALHEIPGCGHAPWLMSDDQIALVVDWLDR